MKEDCVIKEDQSDKTKPNSKQTEIVMAGVDPTQLLDNLTMTEETQWASNDAQIKIFQSTSSQNLCMGNFIIWTILVIYSCVFWLK